MNGRFLYPRLTDTAAQSIRQELLHLTPSQAADHMAYQHPATYFAAVGGLRVTPAHLTTVRERVLEETREIMARAFAGDLNRQSRAAIDLPLGRALHSAMEIIPSDAADVGVWSFMSLVLLPEVTVARFPDGHVDRWLGRPRNALRRTWWRQHTLGDLLDGAGLGAPLGEDELVGIFERPTIGSDPRVSRAIALRVLRQEARGRSEFARRLSRRVLAEMAIVETAVLDDDELETFIDDAMAERGVPPTRQPVSAPRDVPDDTGPEQEPPTPPAPPPAKRLSLTEQRERLQRLLRPSGWGPPGQ